MANLGFLARDNSTNDLLVLTAGHCMWRGDNQFRQQVWRSRSATLEFRTIGPRVKSRWGTHSNAPEYDVAAIRVDNAGLNPRAWVNVQRSGGSPLRTGDTHATTLNTQYLINGDAANGGAMINSRVCKTGARTGTTCGRILRTQATTSGCFTDNFGTLCSTGTRLIESTMCSLGGDSGAPVYRQNKAHGLVSAGTDGPVADGFCRTLYQGIRNAQEELNIRLFTGS